MWVNFPESLANVAVLAKVGQSWPADPSFLREFDISYPKTSDFKETRRPQIVSQRRALFFLICVMPLAKSYVVLFVLLLYISCLKAQETLRCSGVEILLNHVRRMDHVEFGGGILAREGDDREHTTRVILEEVGDVKDPVVKDNPAVFLVVVGP